MAEEAIESVEEETPKKTAKKATKKSTPKTASSSEWQEMGFASEAQYKKFQAKFS